MSTNRKFQAFELFFLREELNSNVLYLKVIDK